MERIIRVPKRHKRPFGWIFCFKELESKRPNWGLVKTFAGTAHATKCFSSVLVRITIEWCFDDPVNAFFFFSVFHCEA